MSTATNNEFVPVQNKILGDREFDKLSEFISSQFGIKLPRAKKTMLQARLQNRLKVLNMDSFAEYTKFIFSGAGAETEVVHMVDAVSTNKTDFFRENQHFEFMKSVILPELEEANSRHIKVWSSASSSGEEAYTIVMTICDFFEGKRMPDLSVLGTDISTRILQKAIEAVYTEDRVNMMTLQQKRKYLLKSKDREKPTVRFLPFVREKATFKRLNLTDLKYVGIPNDHDIVFCRNVLIYFDRQMQEKVINRLCSHLKPGGYFFLGHSESINGLHVPLKQLKPTIYQKI
jgi:chemotaxis protein methyltransferase CheR